MGPPRTRAQHFLAQRQRGRFQEGSMNDRISAVPPVHFLGPQEREAAERPVYTGQCASGGSGVLGAAYFGRREDKQPLQTQQVPQPQPQPRLATRKSAAKMNIFGQVWEGVRGRLGLRRDADDREKAAARSDAQDDRPSRDQVFASYQQLVASGFFSSHAIQSTRHGPPPNYRPSTSHGGASSRADCAPPPQWPLAPRPFTPQGRPGAQEKEKEQEQEQEQEQEPTPQTVCSPVSVASSRGTKRAAASPVPSVHEDGGEEGEDESTLAHRFLPKRLRISASRDISLPKLRSVASRKNLRAAAASAASAARSNVSVGAHKADGKEDEPDQLTGRLLWTRQQREQQARASLDVPPQGRSSGEIHGGGVTRKIRRPTSARNLRSAGIRDGEGGALKVVPDANRGIPRVPEIPVKFTYGEDRENGGPWRGLRR